MPVVTVERNDSLLTGRNLWQNQTQEGWPSASTSWGLRRQKRGEKHHNTIRRTSVGTGKHELITTIMSHLHNIIEKSNRGKKSKVRKGVTDEVPQQSKPIAA